MAEILFTPTHVLRAKQEEEKYPALRDLIRVQDPALRRALWTWESMDLANISCNVGKHPGMSPLIACVPTKQPALDVAVSVTKANCAGMPGYVGHAWDLLKDSVRPGYGCAWQQYLADAVIFDTVHNLTAAHRVLNGRNALAPAMMGVPLTGDTMFYGTRLVRMVSAAEVPADVYAVVLPSASAGDEPQRPEGFARARAGSPCEPQIAIKIE